MAVRLELLPPFGSVDVFGQQVGQHHTVIFWAYREHRRFIVPFDHADAKQLARRVLRRFPGGEGHYANLQAQLNNLHTVGRPCSVRFANGHTVGLVRPCLHGELDAHRWDAPAPVMISRPGTPAIVFHDLDAARMFAARARDERGVHPAAWVAFTGEYQIHPVEKLLVEIRDGTVLRSQLEDELEEFMFSTRQRMRKRAS